VGKEDKVVEVEAPSKTKVKVIDCKEGSALVEWVTEDGLKRVYVPEKKIVDGMCLDKVLDAGIPYGVPWAQFLDVSEVTPENIQRTLYQHGIWTAEDIMADPTTALRAVQAACRRLTGSLLKAAKETRVKSGG